MKSAEVTGVVNANTLLEPTGELSRLHDRAAEVADSHRGRLALVYGEAGIGNTALLR